MRWGAYCRVASSEGVNKKRSYGLIKHTRIRNECMVFCNRRVTYSSTFTVL